jgi:primosomal protein N' (replication factor Y)
VATVVTDVAGMDKEFDYLVPASMPLEVGAMVRVPLGGRRVGGWVVRLAPRGGGDGAGRELRAVARRRGFGPTADLVELSSWAAWRWAGRRESFLGAASPRNAVAALPEPSPRPPAPPRPHPDLTPGGPGLGSGPIMLRWAPAADPTPVVAAAAQSGPTLVVVPTLARAAVLAERLRRAGAGVALLPGEWARARAGAGVVVGARSAAWGPCPGLAAAVVVDAHDEGLAQEGAPTWDAVTVVSERARRAGALCVLLTPCPTPELAARFPVRLPGRNRERAGWAALEVVDRRGDDPRLGLYSERLVALVRSGSKVACVLNRKGRVRLLACSACAALVRCAACGGATGSPEPGLLSCGRCGETRPTLCAACGSTALKALRFGTTRAREDLERLAGRPVGEVVSGTAQLPATGVLVGTSALLERLSPSWGLDAVAFVDFDQELLAPRVRASSEALALLSQASRLVRGRRGRVVVQTRLPDHPVVRAALLAEPGLVAEEELPLRRALRLPPFAAVAVLHGEGAGALAAALRERPGVEVVGPPVGGAGQPVGGAGAQRQRWLVKAADHQVLCDALAALPRPPAGVRISVDPARL